MAKKKGTSIPWTPIILIGGAVVAYTQRDKIMPMINDLKGKVGLRAKAYYMNTLPYYYSGIKHGQQWYPYHQTHWSW